VSIWQDLWASFKAVFGPVATLAALALAVWGGLYPPAAAVQISIIWIVVAVIVVVMALATAWDMVAGTRANDCQAFARRSCSARIRQSPQPRR